MSENWRISQEHSWRPAVAPDNGRMTAESWRQRWYRLTGKWPPHFKTDGNGEPVAIPDRIGHLL